MDRIYGIRMTHRVMRYADGVKAYSSESDPVGAAGLAWSVSSRVRISVLGWGSKRSALARAPGSIVLTLELAMRLTREDKRTIDSTKHPRRVRRALVGLTDQPTELVPRIIW